MQEQRYRNTRRGFFSTGPVIVYPSGMLYNEHIGVRLMQFYTTFFTNVSILITCAYLFNLVFKYMFQHTSLRIKQSAVLVIFILSGWLTMVFGIRTEAGALFDLRVVPLIFGTLVFRDPRHMMIVGVCIALLRFTITGASQSAVSGFLVYLSLTLVASGLIVLFRSRTWSYRRRAVTSIVALNSLQVVLIFTIGAIPRWFYLQQIAVYTYPLGMLLSGFFVFIMRDFYKEQQRVHELRDMNLILRRQTRELREAKRELEEKARQLLLASRYKSEFMANMSHELKTPLNSIILLSQMIREADPETERNEEIRYAEIIHNSGTELLQMINDILDLSKVEAGKMDIMLETVSLEDVAQLLEHQLQPMAERKGLRFAIEMDDAVPETIVTDALRLSQILRNLLVNAVKFTETGGVTMRVTIEEGSAPPAGGPPRLGRLRTGDRRWRDWVRSGAGGSRTAKRVGRQYGIGSWAGGRAADAGAANGDAAKAGAADVTWIVFAVTDTGIGIEADKQKLIFEAFQQEDGAINRKYGGTGLGLSISLQLARLLGGGLTLESVKNEGSTFALRLPLNRTPDASGASAMPDGGREDIAASAEPEGAAGRGVEV